MSKNEEIVLREATFSPRVKTYIFFVVLFFLFTSVIGIILVPFWIFGLGQWLSGKYFTTLSCQITNKNLKFSKGLVLHIEKTIPVENIQDLSFVGGPILRYFGLTLIKIETAGGGGAGRIEFIKTYHYCPFQPYVQHSRVPGKRLDRAHQMG